MKDWTDEELGALLTETFVAQEDRATATTARRIAQTAAPRRRWPAVLVAAAVVALVVAGTTYVVDRPEETRQLLPGDATVPAPSTSRPPGPTYADNVRTARKESARVMALAPVPPGAKRLPGEPAAWPKTGSMSSGASTRGLQRVNWYSWQSDADQIRTYVLAHTPQGLQRDGDVGRRIGNVLYTDYYPASSRRLPAYAGPGMLVQWHNVGGQTLIRVEVYIQVRPPRPADTFLAQDVTSVDVDRIVMDRQASVNNKILPRVTLTERSTIRQLIAIVNELLPSPPDAGFSSCPMPGNPRPRQTLTFRSDSAVVVLDWSTSCGGQVVVTRNGHTYGTTLDPYSLATRFERAIADAADAG